MPKYGSMRILIFIAFFLCRVLASGQHIEIDSLKELLSETRDDERRVYILESLSYEYSSSSPDSALQYALRGLKLAQDIKSLKGEATCVNAIGNVYFHTGDNAKALEMYLQYLALKETLGDQQNISIAYYNISSAYAEEKDYQHALHYLFKARKEDEKTNGSVAVLYDFYSLASIYQRMNKTDSALYYANLSRRLASDLGDNGLMAGILNTFGEIHLLQNDVNRAKEYYRQSIPLAAAIKDYEVLSADYFGLAKAYNQKQMLDSAIHNARKAFYIARDAPFFKLALEISTFTSDMFKTKNKYDSALHYMKLSVGIRDSLFNGEQVKKVQRLKLQEQQRQQVVETERIRYEARIKLFVVLFISGVLLIIALLLWRNNRLKNNANIMITQEKVKVESTLSKLRATQSQLIQSEKMASLGELTAGIAHEIQNPLNFVNNFSEVNEELLSELKGELSKGKIDDAIALANDVIENQKKINHHGKRADAIVKGMLQHSRTSSGTKEPTDINALCDEYLRLSYHGLRAKDKSLSAGQAGFNARLETNFDSTLEKIDVIPQDIGRVILNLINNAFYAVAEKNKTNLEGYEPTVSISTKKLNASPDESDGRASPDDTAGLSQVEITVRDNGTGIPQQVVDKIFQPFFTTKPTGQGTGLGLSLSYDIVKAHGGTLQVETIERAGSEFIITLPANSDQ